MTPRLMGRRARRRDHIEQALAIVAGALVDVDEVILRQRQAMRRTNLADDVLDPALQRLIQIRKDLIEMQDELKQAWWAEQKARWNEHEDQD